MDVRIRDAGELVVLLPLTVKGEEWMRDRTNRVAPNGYAMHQYEMHDMVVDASDDGIDIEWEQV